MANLAGINLAMQTPFNEDGSIDCAEWERLIDLYIEAGVHGLVLGAGTGQHPAARAAFKSQRLVGAPAVKAQGRLGPAGHADRRKT